MAAAIRMRGAAHRGAVLCPDTPRTLNASSGCRITQERIAGFQKKIAAQGQRAWAAFGSPDEGWPSCLLSRSVQPLQALNRRGRVYRQSTALLKLGRRKPRRSKARASCEAAVEPSILGADRRGVDAALNHSPYVVERVDRGDRRLTAAGRGSA